MQTAGCENPEKPFGAKTVLLPCRNEPLEERKVVTTAFFPVSGNESVIAISINHGQFCPGFGLLSGFESCADKLGSFIARAVAEILQEFPCCGCLYFWGLTVTQHEFPSMWFMVLLVWFFCLFIKRGVFSLLQIWLQALDQRVDLEFLL